MSLSGKPLKPSNPRGDTSKKESLRADLNSDKLRGKRQNDIARPDERQIFVGAVEYEAISLAYINMEISATSSSKPLRIMAIHDSGCAYTSIKTATFMKMVNAKLIEVMQPEKEVNIISCTGEATPIRGYVDIFMHFQGENGSYITLPKRMILHDHLGTDILLGVDFTGSPHKLFETNTHMYLSDKPRQIKYIEEFLQTHNQDFCKIPLVRYADNQYPLHITNDIVIPPFTPAVIKCKVKSDWTLQKSRNDPNPQKFEIISIAYPEISWLPAMYEYEDKNEIEISIYNDANTDFELTKDTFIGHIALLDKQNPVYAVNFTSFKCDKVEINNAMFRPNFIEEDSELTEDEKSAAFIDYIASGTFQPSMSHYIEKAPSVTEMEYKNIKPFTQAEFREQFKLDHLTRNQQLLAMKVFKKHIKAFSRHDYDLGLSNSTKMTIEVDETKPRIQKYVPIPHAVRTQVKQVLDQLIQFGIIRECHEASLFCSNLLVVPKRDKTKIRVLFDGRLLNHATKRYPTSTVTQQEVLTHNLGKNMISTMDLSASFFQLGLADEAQPLTVFYSPAHGKRYCFTRCPQGLKNSPLFLKLQMDRMFGDMPDTVIHYADDVMLSTKGTFEEHLIQMDIVLQRFEDHNIKIQPGKVCLAKETLEFLGIVWDRGILKVPEAKLSAFKNYPTPRTPKQAKSFVCAMSYYRRFIPRFAELSKPIMDLSTLHPKEFKWAPHNDLQFKHLISQLIQHSSLYLPDPEKTFYVQTDASDVAGAGRVFQRDSDGSELLISCISRTFSKTECKYGAFRKEVLALLYTLRSMDFFLRFAKKMVILTDAKSILNLRMCKDNAGILLRFSLELSKYDAEVHHVSGKDNVISDILSRDGSGFDELMKSKHAINYLSEKESEHILKRLIIPEGTRFDKEELVRLLELPSIENPILKPKKKSISKPGKRIISNLPKTLHDKKVNLPKETFRRPGVKLPMCTCTTQQVYGLQCCHMEITYSDMNSVAKAVTEGILTPQQFIQAQDADEHISEIKSKRVLPKVFKLEKGMLFLIARKGLKPVLPEALIDPLIQAKHFTVFGMHNSKARISRDIRKMYYVHARTLNHKLRDITRTCLICQYNVTAKNDHTLRPSSFKQAPRVCWAVDIMPNLNKTTNGHNAIFLAIDVFTGYIQLHPLKSRETKEIIEAILNTIIRPFGVPQILRCDNETGMANSKEFKQFFEPLRTQFVPTSHSSPWGNGSAERAVQTIKTAARKFCQQEQEFLEWDQYLHFFTAAHNKSTSVYGFAPEELHFGFKNPSEIDLLQFWPDSKDPVEYMEIILNSANENRASAQGRVLKHNEDVMTYRNIHRSTKSFKVGELVLHKSLQLATGTNMALKPRMLGPYCIVAIEKHGSSALIENMKTKKVSKAHFSNLQLLNYCPNTARVSHRFDERIMKFLPSNKNSRKKYRSSEPVESDPESDLESENEDEPTLNEDDVDQFEPMSQPSTSQRAVPLDANCPNCRVREEHCTCVQGWNRRHRINQHTPTDFNEADHVFLEDDTYNPSPPRYREDLFDPENENAYNPRDWLFHNTPSSQKEQERRANIDPKSILKVKTDEVCSQALERLSQEHENSDNSDNDEEESSQQRQMRTPDLVIWSLPDDYEGSDFDDDPEIEFNRQELPPSEQQQQPEINDSPEVDLENFNFDDVNDFDGPDNYDPSDDINPFVDIELESNTPPNLEQLENDKALKIQYPNDDLIDEIIDMETNELNDLSQGKTIIPTRSPSKKIKDIKNQKKKKTSKHVQFSKEPPRRSSRIREQLLERDIQPRSLRGSRTKYNLR